MLTWKEFNKTSAQKDEITYKGFRFGDGDFFNSVDAYIEFNGGGMFNTDQRLVR